jgi:hypothetical protein
MAFFFGSEYEDWKLLSQKEMESSRLPSNNKCEQSDLKR